ncbi:hypothetical protein [Saccharospirillum salsuginis]|uniref:Uncharacterized protein n=1 Tax=Saccharospirillum salsuginis TaxID=418750 RepID=A0A918NFT0_9GAMM|nr:hypothetical protein [Saccharospirillum salsuginis]GGX64296.1 hypothetical protein GCM10007392_35020 [Saccharospirillum salsuginis]
MFIDRILPPKISASVNQSDRLDGIADYLGSEGMVDKLVWIAIILIGMLVLIQILRWTAARKKKRDRARREQRRAKAQEEKQRGSRRPPPGVGRRPGSQPPRRR